MIIVREKRQRIQGDYILFIPVVYRKFSNELLIENLLVLWPGQADVVIAEQHLANTLQFSLKVKFKTEMIQNIASRNLKLSLMPAPQIKFDASSHNLYVLAICVDSNKKLHI